MLFSPNGILGPFSARIAIGKALVSIDDDTHHDLSLLGKIRNRFAHDLSVSSFNEPEMARWVDSFRTRPKPATPDPEFADRVTGIWKGFDHRGRFEFVGLSICMSLHTPLNAIRNMSKRQRPGGPRCAGCGRAMPLDETKLAELDGEEPDVRAQRRLPPRPLPPTPPAAAPA
jgi:hypothetical protein